MFSVSDFPGLSVNGRLNPETENPDPLIVAELMVRAALPDDVNVSDWVAEVLSCTAPKLTVDELNFRLGPEGLSCNSNVDERPLKVPVRVTFCIEVTADAEAVKSTLVSFAGMVTVCGTFTAELLLERPNSAPAAGAVELSEIVHAMLAVPVTDELLQVRELRTAELDPAWTDLLTVNPAQPLSQITSHPATTPAKR